MREIEFRGYDPDTKRWHYGSYVALEENTVNPWNAKPDAYDDNIKHYIFFTESMDWNLPTRKLRATVDSKSVGQFTNLHDKNGKRIYEGDIVRFDLGGGEVVIRPDRTGVVGSDGVWQGQISHRQSEVVVTGTAYEKETP